MYATTLLSRLRGVAVSLGARGARLPAPLGGVVTDLTGRAGLDRGLAARGPAALDRGLSRGPAGLDRGLASRGARLPAPLGHRVPDLARRALTAVAPLGLRAVNLALSGTLLR